MKVIILKPFSRRGVSMLPGNIIDVPENMISSLAGFIESLPTTCQAMKTSGKVCGAPLKTGLNGFLSCSDMTCQVPYRHKHHEMEANKI